MHVSFIRILTSRNALPAIVCMIVTAFRQRTVQILRLANICMGMLLRGHTEKITSPITAFRVNMRLCGNRTHQRQCITAITMRMLLSYRTFQILSRRVTKVSMFMAFPLRLFAQQFPSFQSIAKLSMNM